MSAKWRYYELLFGEYGIANVPSYDYATPPTAPEPQA